MENLLQTYSVKDVLMFLIMFALAVKGAIDFCDWAYNRIKVVFDKEHIQEQQDAKMEDRLQQGFTIMAQLEKNQGDLTQQLNNLANKVDLLIDSNKEDIKSFITKEHHYYCYRVGWIDDYSLECCEKRFAYYKQEGGNSFIESFMEELRQLPKQPPTQHHQAPPVQNCQKLDK